MIMFKNHRVCMGALCVALSAHSAFAEIAIDFAPVAAPEAAITVARPVDVGDEETGVTQGEGAVDVLKFINGDSLHGVLVSISPADHGLRWRHASVQDPIDISLEAVAQVKLGKRESLRQRSNDASVRLTNSDLLNGELISLSDDVLALDTWYAGRLVVKRPMLATLEPNLSASSTIYEGPTDLSNWTVHRSGAQSWTFKKGALYASTSYAIGRNIDELPDMADIKFEVSWQHRYPSFYFSFHSDNLSSYSGNCYALRVSNTSVYMYRYSSHRGSQSLGNVSVQELSRVKNAKFNILCDKKNRAFTLLINGREVKQWTDPGAVPGAGKGIVFDPESENPMKVQNISITKWDGKVPSRATETDAESKEDVIRFVNNDKVSGYLKTIADGNAKFETSYAALDVPLARAVKIDMSTETAERARRNGNDIRAHFAGGGVVTVGLAGMANDTVEGRSENFGTAKMPLGAFDLLEFNIYRDKSEENGDGSTF
jgi:hypothetical protein